MAAVWPVELQQYLQKGSYKESPRDAVIRTDMDSGPRKTRARFTQADTILSGAIWIDKADYTTFKDFYDITLQNGTMPFDFAHPISDEVIEWTFDKVYAIGEVGALTFRVDMIWRENLRAA